MVSLPFVNRYYGLDALSRTMYLQEDLLKANQTIKQLRTKTNGAYGAVARQRERYEQRIDDLQDQVRWLRRKLDQKPTVIRDTVYDTQIIERHDAIMKHKGIDHPVEVRKLFMRLGNQYYQFPFGDIICPDPATGSKTCVDVKDVIRDYETHRRERGAEGLHRNR